MESNMNMDEEKDDNKPEQRRSNRIWAGMFVIAVGLVFLADRLGANFPEWLFSWPMLLIAFGMFAGIKHGFRNGGWIILILVGSIFLFDRVYDGSVDLLPFLLPALLIIIGLAITLRPWRNHRHAHYRRCGAFRDRARERRRFHEGETEAIPANEDFLEAISIFGGSQKNIFSKNFKGGDVTAIFGGNDLNLTQADFTGSVVLEVVNIFGGTTIMVPSNWQVKDEMVNIFGGTDDKRVTPPIVDQNSKILIISGVSVFGGVEIKSF